MKYIKQKKGVTLLEAVLAAMLLFAIVSLAYMIYFTGFSAYRRNAERVEFQQNVRQSVSLIAKRLLNASNASGSVTITGPPPVLRILNATNNGQTEAFRLVGTTLQVNYNYGSNPATFNPLAENISEFIATRAGDTVSITISTGSAGSDDFYSVSTQILLR